MTSFYLNETTCFVIKKKERNDVVLKGTIHCLPPKNKLRQPVWGGDSGTIFSF
jgi:hypothetical protein